MACDLKPGWCRYFRTAVFLLVLLTVSCIPGPLRFGEERPREYRLPEGFHHERICLTDANGRSRYVADGYFMEDSVNSRMRFVSRAAFEGKFTFRNVERQCRRSHVQIVLQVAAAFTPDWEVIEGFALENGRSVGQDSYPGENDRLIYGGIVGLRDGKPFITHLDSLPDSEGFVREAVANRWSLFMQATAIANGRTTTMDLPGTYLRRFLVQLATNGESRFGVVDFQEPMTFADAVAVLRELEDDQTIVQNAVYLDMGSVSQGYLYDAGGRRHRIGGITPSMSLYTNLLVLYRIKD
jgi:hypothetical protein